MRWKVLVVLAVVAVLAVLVAAPSPAQAFSGDKFGAKAFNTGANVLFGWTDCFKAVGDEVSKAKSRGYVGVVVSGPVMCGANVSARYLGVAADILTLPWGGNSINPAVYENANPPLRLP